MTEQHHPKKIDKYLIKKVLGQGAMGVVYQGFDETIERLVAVKVLHPHLREGEFGGDLEQRFVQEAKAAARCLHPNIVTVFDFGIANETPYIVMEYVEGVELKQKIMQNQIGTVGQAIKIAQQILSALDFAHQNGVVHRDIKPANIIILSNGQVKVSDFGVARLDTSDLTSAGFMVGTPNYMSPEGLRGQKVDNRSDIYSVGLLLLEMITKNKPYAGKNNHELLQNLVQFTRAADVNLLELQELVRRSLEENPQQRFQSAGEFSISLESLLNAQRSLLDTLETQIRPVSPDDPTMISPSQEKQAAEKLQPGNTASGSNWHPDILKVIENSLAKFIGPMASFLVRKNSRTVYSVSDLSNTLAEHIPTQLDRKAFLEHLASTGIFEKSASSESGDSHTAEKSGDSTSDRSNASQIIFGDQSRAGSQTGFSSNGLSPEDIDKVAQKLTVYLGPMGPRITKKAAKKSANLDELINRVIGHIPNEKEKQAFLNSLR